MSDAPVYWIETAEEEIHFIDAIVSAYDGLATVRREFKIDEGATLFKVYVAVGMEDEFIQLLDRLRKRGAEIGRVIRGGEEDGPVP